MGRYRVLLVVPYCTWDDVKAENGQEAISRCNYPDDFDLNQDFFWIAEEIEDDEEKEKYDSPEPKPFLFEP